MKAKTFGMYPLMTGTDRAALASTEAKAKSIASDINREREKLKGGEANHRAAVDMAEATTGREREKAKRLDNILDKEEILRDRLIDDI